jgi:hypothetical protein
MIFDITKAQGREGPNILVRDVFLSGLARLWARPEMIRPDLLGTPAAHP